MKNLIILTLLVHGIIHLMGFLKAFKLVEINQISQSVSKPLGLLWALSSILFIVAMMLLIFRKSYWFVFAMVAVIISQILIILFWKDAKYGTAANIIILVASIIAFGNYQFNVMVENETMTLKKDNSNLDTSKITQNDVSHLPSIIQQWLRHSGVIGKEKVRFVYLTQTGKMRTTPNSKWMHFTAKQNYNIDRAEFIWSTDAYIMPYISLKGRDKLTHGNGEMLIKLAALFPVVNEGNNEQIDTGAMLRYLAEICWFPQAATNDYLKWESINATSAKATLSLNDKSVSGIFTFNTQGEMLTFEAKRYYGGKEDAQLENWLIESLETKTFNGVMIPNKCKVTWKLASGDFTWLHLEITDVVFH